MGDPFTMLAVLSKEIETMNVLGVDCSLTSTGIAMYNAKKGYHTVTRIVTKSGVPEGDRLALIFNQFSSIVKGKLISLVVMEGPSFASTNRSFSMGAAYGVIKMVCSMEGIRLVEIPPLKLKKYFTGKGTAGKGTMLDTALSLRISVSNHDEADAAACCCLARDIMHSTNTPGTRAALEVINTVKP
jgi:Holliday junction resolvasome RuvABC endonuclease subunit